jgi:hypothetical protein
VIDTATLCCNSIHSLISEEEPRPLSKPSAARVINWLHALDADFFTKSFDTVVSYTDKCLNRGNDYTEK